MIFIKIIDVMGYSGSGKTHFIAKAISMLKKHLNYNIAVIKNVKHHQIDQEGKDSSRFSTAGASYSIITNNNNDIGVFLKIKENKFKELIDWLQNGPYHIDLLITEGFRNLHNPTLLCVKNIEEIEPQLNENIKMISGLICSDEKYCDIFSYPPILDLDKNFHKFLEIFNIV
ncbi:MAG: molybdopterin-guanine dinucleotide biosynthesis protein B [Candidatus Thorarchaeota archaeon]